MITRIYLSFLIFLLICVPTVIVSIPVVAMLLLTKWDGRSTVFGNAKWGRANNHFATPTKGWWQEFNWLVIRNPVNNLLTNTLATKDSSYYVYGDTEIGDKKKGGFYRAETLRDGFWEYYWVKPYGRRCVRMRVGWKLVNSDRPAAFVFAFNPWKEYLGA